MKKRKKILKTRIFTISISCLICFLIIGQTISTKGAVEKAEEKTNTTTVTFFPYSEYFLVNNDLLEAEVCPVNYNDTLYVPLNYTVEMLGYTATGLYNKIQVKNEASSYTVDYGKNLIKNNKSNETILNVNFLTLDNKIYIDLNNLVAVFSLHDFEKEGVYTISNVNDSQLFKEASKAYDEFNISTFIPFKTKKSFDNYINMTKKFRDLYYFDFVYGEVNFSSEAIEESVVSESSRGESVENEDYSGTVTQYDTVDEGDVIKTDGEYIYYARVSNDNYRDSVEIILTKDNGKSEIISTIFVEKSSIDDLYIADKKLIIIGSYNNRYDNISYGEKIAINEKNENFALQYDIDNKKTPKLERESYFTGNYFDSRLIDNRLYIYTRDFSYEISEDMLPKYKNDLNDDYKNISYDNIYYNTRSLSNGTIFAIYSFNLLDTEEDLTANSFFTNSDEMNVNDKNMYLFTGDSQYIIPVNLYLNNKDPMELFEMLGISYVYDNNSAIYKFEMDNGDVTFIGGANVKGSISSQYNMDEHNGYLRVATNGYDKNYRAQVNKLYVFDEKMKEVGKIDNFAENENMHSVRFMGDKAYIVTFRNVDPLFAIDLKDPKNPTILGELKIPGFSNFMLPIDENHLIGIGTDTKEQNGGFIIIGMKLSLFDVTDMLNPKEKFVTSIGIRGTYSDVQNNPRALMYNKDRGLLGFPLTYVGETRFQGATVYNVDVEKGFNHLGYIIHTDEEKLKNYEERDVIDEIEMSGSSYFLSKRKIERIIQIKDNLYTVSNKLIKTTSLKTFKELSEIYFDN